MQNDLTKLLEDASYEEADELEMYREYTPHKMSKKEFIKEMLRLQEEKNLYPEQV